MCVHSGLVTVPARGVSSGLDRRLCWLSPALTPRLRYEPSAPEYQSGTRSALAVSHDFDGLLRTQGAGLFHPATDHGVRLVADPPGCRSGRADSPNRGSSKRHRPYRAPQRPPSLEEREGEHPSPKRRVGAVAGAPTEVEARGQATGFRRLGRALPKPSQPVPGRSAAPITLPRHSHRRGHPSKLSPRPQPCRVTATCFPLDVVGFGALSTAGSNRPQGLSPCPSPLRACPVMDPRARCSLGLSWFSRQRAVRAGFVGVPTRPSRCRAKLLQDSCQLCAHAISGTCRARRWATAFPPPRAALPRAKGAAEA